MLKLTYSNLEFQNFPGEDPGTPLRGEGTEGEGRGGQGGEGKEGERDGKGQGRREGGGGEGCSTWAPPPRDKLWIRP